jgi:DNA-3-methyladenine glycosylase
VTTRAPRAGKILAPSFYLKPTVEVARGLLGKGLFVRAKKASMLVELTEVEAYLGEDDPASHAYRGSTDRTWPMFEVGGTCYVYVSYGMHYCINVSTGPKGVGNAVLFRAAKPLEGIDAMILNRGLQLLPREKALPQLLSGPGKLTQALGIDLGYKGKRFDRPDFKLVDLGVRVPRESIVASPRVGISKAKEAQLRFSIKSSPWLSRKVKVAE